MGIFSKKVITRFAPSPTGNLHVGSARTALFNYLFTRKHGGKFLLRIEDTDKERSKKEFEEDILAGLSWLGISYDGEIIRQSERTDIYRSYLEKMIESGAAYEAEENENKTGNVIRFKNPNTTVTFNDLIRGEISFDTTELKDFVVAKDRQTPLYHLAVVVDDHEMGVTHIIRGEDHISNTPRQLLIQAAIGAKRPQYAHIPLILAPDRSKLSKRHGAVSVTEYKKEGYLPEALVNFLALLGWNPGTEKEIFGMDELIEDFDIEKVQKGGAVFNEEKLKWFNREHLLALPHESVAPLILEHLSPKLKEKVMADRERGRMVLEQIILPRIHIMKDVEGLEKSGELQMFFEAPTPGIDKLVWKNGTKESSRTHLTHVIEMLPGTFENIDAIKNAIMPYADKEGRGDVLWPLRYALSGLEKSADPFTLAFILGKDETIQRIKNAINILS